MNVRLSRQNTWFFKAELKALLVECRTLLAEYRAAVNECAALSAEHMVF